MRFTAGQSQLFPETKIPLVEWDFVTTLLAWSFRTTRNLSRQGLGDDGRLGKLDGPSRQQH